ncbi:MAG TPA: glycolate oxidase subunit GlcF [Nevskia sp.]|nr:glycolate oxidase subunit GlcF [Nevskia sp.]
MQTQLPAALLETADGREADAILRKCVHCGFCTATCPTYQLLGDELDGPRGRIYLMQQALEGAPVTAKTQLHLDRCLTCRSCETTCPSGVRYGRLLDIGRRVVEQQVPRGLWQRVQRKALLLVLPNRPLFGALLWLGRRFRPLLPGRLRRAVPPRHPAGAWPAPRHARRMLLLRGCVQPALAPNIDAAAARVLDRAGVSLLHAPGAASCCGALAHHLSAEEMALEQARRNIDAWWPQIERGAEAVVVTASGCGTMVKDYGTLLREDPRYAGKAAQVSALFRDLSQAVAAEAAKLPRAAANRRVAVHSPCSLQHGLQIRGTVEEVLRHAGCTVLPVKDAHLCCGSAGTYSILQPQLSRQLRADKLAALEAGEPELIVTANIGCLTHLGAGAARPVRHWIELLDEALAN